jgi:hypothetical protein
MGHFRITAAELGSTLSIAQGRVTAIIEVLGGSKACALWAPRTLTNGERGKGSIRCRPLSQIETGGLKLDPAFRTRILAAINEMAPHDTR